MSCSRTPAKTGMNGSSGTRDQGRLFCCGALYVWNGPQCHAPCMCELLLSKFEKIGFHILPKSRLCISKGIGDGYCSFTSAVRINLRTMQEDYSRIIGCSSELTACVYHMLRLLLLQQYSLLLRNKYDRFNATFKYPCRAFHGS